MDKKEKMWFRCRRCGAKYQLDRFYQPCPKCGAPWTETQRMGFLEP